MKKPVVLFVDDERNALESYARVLRGEPYSIVLASSGEKALEILEQRNVDLLISDQEMPGMKGTRLLAAVRDSYPGVTRILLTGTGSLDVALAAINEGEVFRFLTKPVDARHLAATIRKALALHNVLRASCDLLETVKAQSDELEQLEKKHPGITRVERDADGCIRLSPESTDGLDLFLESAREQLDRVKARSGAVTLPAKENDTA